jgi:hypothetical protein
VIINLCPCLQTSPKGVVLLQQRVAAMAAPALGIVATIVGLQGAQVRLQCHCSVEQRITTQGRPLPMQALRDTVSVLTADNLLELRHALAHMGLDEHSHTPTPWTA